MVTERLGRGRRAARLVVRLELPLIALWLGLGWALSAIDAHRRLVRDDRRAALRAARDQRRPPALAAAARARRADRERQPALPAADRADSSAHGLVPGSLRAHLLNAFVMTSACIPAFLLARRVTGKRWAAYAMALLTMCVPWILFSGFLLTEVVGYPAFLWAVLAIQRATVAPSRRNDAILVLGLGLAIVSRTQFDVLLVVPPLAFFLSELVLAPGPRRRAGRRKAFDGHRRSRPRPHLVDPDAPRARSGRTLLVSAFGTYGSAVQGQSAAGGHGPLAPRARRRPGPRARDPAVRRRHGLAPGRSPPPGRGRPGRSRRSAFGHGRRRHPRGDELRRCAFVGGVAADRYLFYLAPLVLTGFAAALCSARLWPPPLARRPAAPRRRRLRTREAAQLEERPQRVNTPAAAPWRLSAPRRALAERRPRPADRGDRDPGDTVRSGVRSCSGARARHRDPRAAHLVAPGRGPDTRSRGSSARTAPRAGP